MTVRKIAIYALPVLLFAAGLTFWIISIWTGDGRWGWTSVPVLLAAMVSLILPLKDIAD
jgi:hypothetical protein